MSFDQNIIVTTLAFTLIGVIIATIPIIKRIILNNIKNEIKKSYENYQSICPFPNGNYRDIFEWFYIQKIIFEGIENKLFLKEMASNTFDINRDIVADKTMNNILSTLKSLSYKDIIEINKYFIRLNKKIKYVKEIILKINLFDKELTNKNLYGEVFFNKYWLDQKMYITLIPGKTPFVLDIYKDVFLTQEDLDIHNKKNSKWLNDEEFELYINSKELGNSLWWKISFFKKNNMDFKKIEPIWGKEEQDFKKNYVENAYEKELIKEIKELKKIFIEDNILEILKINEDFKEGLIFD